MLLSGYTLLLALSWYFTRTLLQQGSWVSRTDVLQIRVPATVMSQTGVMFMELEQAEAGKPMGQSIPRIEHDTSLC